MDVAEKINTEVQTQLDKQKSFDEKISTVENPDEKRILDDKAKRS